MSTYSKISESLISEFADSPNLVDRVAKRLAGPWSELTLGRLSEHLTPEEHARLPFVVGRLAELGLVVPIYRVESRSGGSIGDFKNVTDIPQEIDDWRTSRLVEVGIGDVRVILTRPEIANP